MSGDALTFRTDGPVATITLSRPPHNFFDVAMITQIADLIEACDRDPGVRLCLLTSDQKNFCAGADFSGGNRPDPMPIYQAAARLIDRRKPLVAVVHGAAIGGGLGLALAADFRIGASDCWFQGNFVRIALSPGFGLSYTLPRLVGAQRARDLLLTGRRVDAQEALDIGLIDRLAPREGLHEATGAFAAELAENAPAAMVATRTLLSKDAGRDFRAAVEAELAHQRLLFASPDFAEGVAASRERRTPHFSAFPGEPQ
ncbi:enoyl-CoA hydratase/isomerase family protein [Sphingobium sp. YBL2]|uniref:enoyl-CoA hydratase/isomerase family protein n=1 Tax=Sphingobium sp. (strain YBL2) TaxID=484429 RepID=UPI0005CB97DF|nr:enoyl-CoA hydratase-related protein [Sphingobium sp. YBL2]AJR24183.1 hypothetical protein TZ53_11045 [Sphingobium sp. YBL2]